MCGIAGLIHRKKSTNVGKEMQNMLQSLKHRGPDSTGYALYGDSDSKDYILRFKVGENVKEGSSAIIEDESIYEHRKDKVNSAINDYGAKIIEEKRITPYSYRYMISTSEDLLELAKKIESVEMTEILSLGKSLELVKDIGDASVVAKQYGLNEFSGTHGIGHTRMATESGVDIRSAHPFWGYPFSDVSVVHNGQLTNYWNTRRKLEKLGMRFMSTCDSELIAVYIANKIRQGVNLEEAMRSSLDDLDGVFTYLVATKDKLGMAKDYMAAKPMVLFESDDLVALASEEVAIRSLLPHEIDTYDPFEGEVKVWQA
ncbi:MAG: Amidophosphoribosyltransferase [Alphaproteobacteria bacterium MarineAlpha5_Bin9]|nr:MAG: Amidophosphoribosyltransferase [Alphaproteobacteria bacterium MarineAlpha5_Bin9]|tara:strand:+ start:26807 stop:27748 length:942 start_codon:yes stop_codon:yes gene_type:complete